MLTCNAINHRGALDPTHPLVSSVADEPVFLITARNTAPKAQRDHPGATFSAHSRDIYITRQDVNEIQLAKAAIRAGIETLLAEANLSVSAIQDFIIAGAFGTYIHIPSAIQIGMFPPLPIERFHQVGNAAGAGARHMLVSTAKRQAAEEIARRVEYIELSFHPNFTSLYATSLFFGKVK
jgi:uncharacterized 2Fe-2S/4Fe-4S cluster protein (DUF4445 family)